MAKPCEAELTAQDIVVSTWSGTRRGQICDLNNPGAIGHWIAIENWKLKPVSVDSLKAEIRSGNPFAKFDCPGASNVSADRWDDQNVPVPRKRGGLRLKPGKKEWGYVTLSRTGRIGSENIFVEVKTSWRRNGRQADQDFSLDIRVDT